MNKTPANNVRLQKVIAASGLSSRRAAETLIREGKVTVNGEIVRVLGTCINPGIDHVKVDGVHIEMAEPEVFVLLHKPAGCVTTMHDPIGRGTVADLLGRVSVRVFPVGRLDFDAEGLLLLTNNGLVAQACLHPRYHVPKTYLVKVSGVFSDEEINILKAGVRLEDGVTSPADVKKSGKAQSNSWLEITIREGRKHQIKRMVEACGHRVMRIKRTRFGPLQLRGLTPGTFRYATDAEANALRAILHRTTTGEKPRSPRTKPYLKNRVRPGDVPVHKSPRMPLRKSLRGNAAKPKVNSATRSIGTRAENRPGVSRKPVSPRPSSRNTQTAKGHDRRSPISTRPIEPRKVSSKPLGAKRIQRASDFQKQGSNFRGNSVTPLSARESDRRSDIPKKLSSSRPASVTRHPRKLNETGPDSSMRSGLPRGTSTKRPVNNTSERRAPISKKPSSSRANSVKRSPNTSHDMRSGYSKKPPNSKVVSLKRYTTKGTAKRSMTSKRSSTPSRNSSTNRRPRKS